MTEIHISQITDFTQCYGGEWKEHVKQMSSLPPPSSILKWREGYIWSYSHAVLFKYMGIA
jgi:hypothetical protein